MVGCGASINQATYGILKTTAEMHNSAVLVVFDLHQKKIISDPQVNKFLNLSDKVKASYDAAQAAFEGYMTVKDAANAAKFSAAVKELQEAIGAFTTFYRVIVKGE
jgi:regulator of RNase E activity RraB